MSAAEILAGLIPLGLVGVNLVTQELVLRQASTQASDVGRLPAVSGRREKTVADELPAEYTPEVMAKQFSRDLDIVGSFGFWVASGFTLSRSIADRHPDVAVELGVLAAIVGFIFTFSLLLTPPGRYADWTFWKGRLSPMVLVQLVVGVAFAAAGFL